MFFSRRVPVKVRSAYVNDTWSGITGNIMIGSTLTFATVIARDELGASEFLVGVLVAAPVFGSMFSLIWARLMEGRRKMPFLVVPLVVSRSLLLFTFFANGPVSFVGLVAGLYFIGSISGPAYSALLKEIYPDGDRARIMSYVRVVAVGVYVIITAVAGQLLHVMSYKYVFPVAAVFGIGSAFIFNRIPTSDDSGDSNISTINFIWDALKILKHDPGFRWFCAGIFIFGAGNFMAAPIYEVYKVDVLGVDTRWQGIYALVSSTTQVFGYLYWGSFIDRTTPVRTVAVTTLVWALVPIIYMSASHPWMLLPAAIIGGAVAAAIELSYFNGVLYFAPESRVTHYQALFATLTGLRGCVAPFVGSALVHCRLFTMKQVFALSLVLILIGFGVLTVGMRLHNTGESSERPAE